MGVSYQAWTVAGRTSGCVFPPDSGVMTATIGTARSCVHFVTSASWPRRSRIPNRAMATAAMAAIRPIRRRFRLGANGFRRAAWSAAAEMQHAEHGRDKKQRRHGRDQQTADHGTPERRILLAPFAQRKRHRQHADDHGQGRHQNGPKPGESGFERRRGRIKALRKAFPGKAHQQDAVGSRYAHTHDGAGERGDRQRRPGYEKYPDNTGQRARERGDDDEGVEPRLEIDDDDQINQHDGAGEAEIELTIGAAHRLDLPAEHEVGTTRHLLAGLIDNAVDVRGNRTKIASLNCAVDIYDRLHVVVRNDAGTRSRSDLGETAEILRCRRIRRRDRHVEEVGHRVDPVLRHLGDDRVGDAVLGVQPEIRLYLAAAGQCDQKTVCYIALRQPDLAGERAIDVHIDLRIVEHLLDARVRDAGYGADALEQVGGVGIVGFQVIAGDLHVDWGRQAEIEDLRDDV